MTTAHRFFLVLITLASLGACTTPSALPIQPSASSPGTSIASAIEVCMPAGEHEYLSRLACNTGEPLQFRRVGSVGQRTKLPAHISKAEEQALFKKMIGLVPLEPGEADYHFIDRYELVCGTTQHFLYFDMYHCGQAASTTPPAGFSIRKQ